jgi:hypothetical protein
MGNDQPALRALFACESGLSETEMGRFPFAGNSGNLA